MPIRAWPLRLLTACSQHQGSHKALARLHNAIVVTQSEVLLQYTSQGASSPNSTYTSEFVPPAHE